MTMRARLAALFTACALLAAGVATAATNARITLDVTSARASNALLEPVMFTLSYKNPGDLVQATFLTADVYQIQIVDAASTVWDSLYQHKAIEVEHTMPIAPGTSRIASYVWDGRTSDHRSLAPGHYRVHVTVLGTLVHPSVDIPIDFATPTPITDAIAGKATSDVTIAGTPQRGETGWELVDATGSIALSRSMGLHAAGQWVVRGHVARVQALTQFVVTEFAPAFDNLDSQVVATPVPLPSGVTPAPRHTLRPVGAPT